MQTGNAEAQVAVAHVGKPGLLQGELERLLVGEAADGLDQISIGFRFARNPCAETWNHGERKQKHQKKTNAELAVFLKEVDLDSSEDEGTREEEAMERILEDENEDAFKD